MGNLRRWALLLAMVGWLGASGTVSAQKNREPARTVQDDAGLFGAAAKDKANTEIADIKRQFKKDFFVETVAEKKFEGDKAAVNVSFNKWAAEKFKNQAVNGIYLVLVKDPGKIRVVVGPKTIQTGLFTNSNRDELVKIISAKIKDDPDGALQQGTAYVHRTLNQNARSSQVVAPGGAPPPRVGGWPPWATYLCIGLVILLVIWLVMGVARGLSGAGAGGGGGGGGGGFMSGMLGGLFGAMAGMWLYNNVFGGHTPSAGAADGGYDGGNDVGGGDPSVGGDDFGGGDAGGGGGDVGGGDWGGGGGGDWGGGGFGGGDFGGGGGGDF